MVITMNIETARFNMIEQQIRPWEVLDPSILELLCLVKREAFVPAMHQDLAFADLEIPLNLSKKPDQTMLVPRLEARILQELNLKNTDKVLEIGSGSGYMAALLAVKAEFVYSVEIDPALVDQARKNLEKNDVANVSVDLGDAAQGWSLYAPYNVIVLSGSLPVVPPALLNMLHMGGRLIGVIGEAPVMQMQLITRVDEHNFNTITLFETCIAPLQNAVTPNKFVF